MKKQSRGAVLREFSLITLATGIVAGAVFFFLIPSHASVSSISGLAIILSNLVPLSVAQLTMLMNVFLMLIGFLVLGKDFGLKTAYTSLLLPLLLRALEKLFPGGASLTGDAFLDVICYIFVVSVGISLLFHANASSGGIDIVAKILNKYLHMDLGLAMSLPGICIALSSALVYDKKTVVLSVLGTYLNGIVLDYFLFGQSVKKRVCIISKREEEVRRFIIEELHSGATIYEAIGAYDRTRRNEIITIVDRHEFQRLMSYLSQTDPAAFITVYTVTEMRYIPKK